MRKLLLILPPHERGLWKNISKTGKTGFVRLSLPTIAALTPPDWEVEILDARVTPIDFDKRVDLVGITAFSAEIPSAYGIADGFRKKGVKVVMGGIHVSALPEEALGHADSVVVGEAESLWRELLEDFKNGALKTVYHGKRLADMHHLPTPRRDLLDREMYVACFNTIRPAETCLTGRCTWRASIPSRPPADARLTVTSVTSRRFSEKPTGQNPWRRS
jgi:radical SAM superfamily enzyme YgiQ (UPF0313 family)